MEDEEILALFFRRNPDGPAAVARKYGPYLRGVAYRVLGQAQDAEECVNDALLLAWNAIPPARPEHLRAYLSKLTRNAALNRRRALGAGKRGGGAADAALEELRDCVAPGDTPEEALLRKQVTESVDRFLQKLPRERRVVFVLRYWYLYDSREIGERLGLREGTVRSMLSRLRRQLKTHLEQEGVL